MIRAFVDKSAPPRRAFTLIELLVSLAVLSLALTAVGVVFNATSKAASEAAALTEMQSWLRQFTADLKADLEGCDPSQSVLVMVGRTVPAALTTEDKAAEKYFRVLVGDPEATGAWTKAEAELTETPSGGLDAGQTQYSDPRADILMFFSNRAIASQAPPIDPDRSSYPPAPRRAEAYLDGTKFSPIQVVYGHASFDSVGDDPNEFVGGNMDELDSIEASAPEDMSPIAAASWILAARRTILEPTAPDSGLTATGDFDEEAVAFQSIIRACSVDSSYQFDGEKAGDVVRFDMEKFLYDLNEDVLNDSSFGSVSDMALARPYSHDNDYEWGELDAIKNVMYAGGDDARHVIAAVIGNPTVELRSNLALQALPGCVWFQVEFLMPEDPRNSLDYDVPSGASNPENYTHRFDPPRWCEIEPGETYVFVPDTAENRQEVMNDSTFARINDFGQIDQEEGGKFDDISSNRKVRMWPYAIRITVRAYDPKGRLANPLVRTIVHRFE